MEKQITVNWQGGMAFSTSLGGHALTTDAPEEFGGKNLGPSPKSLMEMSLAGCTGVNAGGY